MNVFTGAKQLQPNLTTYCQFGEKVQKMSLFFVVPFGKWIEQKIEDLRVELLFLFNLWNVTAALNEDELCTLSYVSANIGRYAVN